GHPAFIASTPSPWLQQLLIRPICILGRIWAVQAFRLEGQTPPVFQALRCHRRRSTTSIISPSQGPARLVATPALGAFSRRRAPWQPKCRKASVPALRRRHHHTATAATPHGRLPNQRIRITTPSQAPHRASRRLHEFLIRPPTTSYAASLIRLRQA